MATRRHQALGWGVAATVVIALFTVYSGVHDYGFLAWDDTTHVTANPHLDDPGHFWTSLYQGFYIPITFSFYSLLYSIAGLHAPTFHLVNLAMHILNSLLVLVLLLELLRFMPGTGPGKAPAGNHAPSSKRQPSKQTTDSTGCRPAAGYAPILAAGAGALLFALHPLQVEPVSWVSSLKDVTVGFFSILAMIFYCRHLHGGGRSVGHVASVDRGGWFSGGRRGWYLAGLVSFTLATLSKPSAAMVVLMLAVIDLFVYHRTLKRIAVALLPWALATVPSVLLNGMAQERLTMFYVTPVLFRPLIALDTITFYLWKLFWPLELLPAYGRSPRMAVESGAVWWTWIPAVILMAVLWWQRKRRPHLVIGFLVFLSGFIMVTGLVYFAAQENTTVYDRYLYLAMIGPSLALSASILRSRFPLMLPLVALILVSLGLKSAEQTRIWMDDENLWTYTVERQPDSAVALINLGIVRSGQERLEETEALYRRAVEITPLDAQARNNLGSVLARLGRLDEAAAQFGESLRLDPKQKSAHRNMARYYMERGQPEQAVTHLEAILDPRNVDSELGLELGEAYWRSGRLDESIGLMERLILRYPGNPDAHTLLGVALAARGDLPPAILSFRRALELDPDHGMARINLRTALGELR